MVLGIGPTKSFAERFISTIEVRLPIEFGRIPLKEFEYNFLTINNMGTYSFCRDDNKPMCEGIEPRKS